MSRAESHRPDDPDGSIREAYIDTLYHNLIIATGANEMLDKASDLVAIMNERSMEITGADIDLSCKKPFYKGPTIFGLKFLAPILRKDAEDIPDLPSLTLQNMLRDVIEDYRQTMLNLLIGIRPSYEQAHQILETVSYERLIPQGLQDMADEGLTFLVKDRDTLPTIIRSHSENYFTDFALQLHNIWAPMFDDNSHKPLALTYVRGKMDETTLRAVFARMNKPTFALRQPPHPIRQ